MPEYKQDKSEAHIHTSMEEDRDLLKAGFEYVTERNNIKLYRRPKLFAKHMDSG